MGVVGGLDLSRASTEVWRLVARCGGCLLGGTIASPHMGADHKQTTSGHMGRLNKTARLYLLGKILGGGGRAWLKAGAPRRSSYLGGAPAAK